MVLISSDFVEYTVIFSRLNWLMRFKAEKHKIIFDNNPSILYLLSKLKILIRKSKGGRFEERILPDFSDNGNNLDRNSWIRPQKTVFWDLLSLLSKSKMKQRLCYVIYHYTNKHNHVCILNCQENLPLHILKR